MAPGGFQASNLRRAFCGAHLAWNENHSDRCMARPGELVCLAGELICTTGGVNLPGGGVSRVIPSVAPGFGFPVSLAASRPSIGCSCRTSRVLRASPDEYKGSVPRLRKRQFSACFLALKVPPDPENFIRTGGHKVTEVCASRTRHVRSGVTQRQSMHVSTLASD